MSRDVNGDAKTATWGPHANEEKVATFDSRRLRCLFITSTAKVRLGDLVAERNIFTHFGDRKRCGSVGTHEYHLPPMSVKGERIRGTYSYGQAACP